MRNERQKMAIIPEAQQLAKDGIAQHLHNLGAEWAHVIDRGLEMCESPIEQLFLAEFLVQPMPVFFHSILWFQYPVVEPQGRYTDEVWMEKCPDFVLVTPQASIGEFRVDFLIRARFHERPLREVLVVECDGHDFHERTKEQAKRDRSRDRTLQSRGLRVFRFTGHEIHRDPSACAYEVRKFLEELELSDRP